MTHDLGQAIPATAELAFLSILIAVIVGVTLGVIAAMRRNKLTDHVLRVVSLGGVSMPTFWIALVALYVFFFRLELAARNRAARPGRHSHHPTPPVSTPSTRCSPASGARSATRSCI